MRLIFYCAAALLLAGCAATSPSEPPAGSAADGRVGETAPPPLAQLTLDAPATQPATARLYTCPMHPQIVQDHPGKCPICSMTLEPKVGAK